MTMASHPILPEPTLRRLPWYLAYVEILKSQGTATVSSTRISAALNVEPSQIAKDLSFLNIKGKTRIGYDVSDLVAELNKFLGFKKSHKAFIIGVGSLGTALIHDKGLANYGLDIVAGFDSDPGKTASDVCGIPVYPVPRMAEIRKLTGAEIAILTVPSRSAQQAADAVVASGLKAVWNFTPYRIRVREGIVMTSTSIYANLALIYNRLQDTLDNS